MTHKTNPMDSSFLNSRHPASSGMANEKTDSNKRYSFGIAEIKFDHFSASLEGQFFVFLRLLKFTTFGAPCETTEKKIYGALKWRACQLIHEIPPLSS